MSVKYKTVYRVESRAKGIGPFGKLWYAMSSEHPTPAFDAGLPEDFIIWDDDIFGAPTKSAMKEWVVEPLILRSHKYVVRKYKVSADKVIASQIQCVFKKADAECVAEYDIVEFMKGKKK